MYVCIKGLQGNPMVIVNQYEESYQIELTPNKSASWFNNVQILMGLGFITAIIALGWYYVGVWMILPFAGFEIGLLIFILHKVSSQCYRKEVLYIDDSEIRIEKGSKGPDWKFAFPRGECDFIFTKPRHFLTPAKIDVEHGDRKVSLGSFLNKEDVAALIEKLKDIGIDYRQRGRTEIHEIKRFDID